MQVLAQGHIQTQQEASGISNNLEHVHDSADISKGLEPEADSISESQNLEQIAEPYRGLAQNLENLPDNGAVDEQIIQALIESQTQQEGSGAQDQWVVASGDMPPPVAVKPPGQFRPAVQIGGGAQQVVHTVRTQQTTVRQSGIPVGAQGPPGAAQVLPPGVVQQAGTVKVQQSTVQVRQPAVQVQQQTVQVRQPAVQVMQPGVQVRQPGVQVQQPAVQVQPVVIRAQQPGGAQIRPAGAQVQQSQVHVQQSQSVVRQSVVSHGGQQVQVQQPGQQVQSSEVKVVQISQAGLQKEQPEIKVGEAVVFQLGGQQAAEGAKPVSVAQPQPAVQVAQPKVQVTQPQVQAVQPQVQAVQPQVQAAQPQVQVVQPKVSTPAEPVNQQPPQPAVQQPIVREPAVVQPAQVEPVHAQPIQAPAQNAQAPVEPLQEAPNEIREDIIEPQQAPPRAHAPPPASPAARDLSVDSAEVSPLPQPTLEQQIEADRGASPEAVQEETIIPTSRQQVQDTQSSVIKQAPSGEQEKVISTRRPLSAPLDRLQKSCKYEMTCLFTKFAKTTIKHYILYIPPMLFHYCFYHAKYTVTFHVCVQVTLNQDF